MFFLVVLFLIFTFGLVVFNHRATIKEEKRGKNDDHEAEMRKRIIYFFALKLANEKRCCRSVIVQKRKTSLLLKSLCFICVLSSIETTA